MILSKMKQFLALILTLSLLFSFAACSNGNNEKEKPTTPTAEDSGEPDVTLPNFTLPAENLDDFSTKGTIEETVLYDENGISITVTEIEYYDSYAELVFIIENNSEKDATVRAGTVGCPSFVVNGIMFPYGYINAEITAGKKTKESVDLYYDNFMPYGIDAFASIEIDFEIVIDDEHTYTGPLAIATNLADTYQNTPYADRMQSAEARKTYEYSIVHFSNKTPIEHDGATILSQCIIKNSNNELHLLLEVENTSAEDIYFKSHDMAVNGLTIYGGSVWSSDIILSNRKAIIDINLYSVLDECLWDAYGISTISTLDLNFKIKKNDKDGQMAALNITVPNTDASFDMTGTELYSSDDTRILFKEIIDDPSEYSDNIFILLLAENKRDKEVKLQEDYGTFSLNGFMSSVGFYGTSMQPSSYSVIKLELYSYNLDDMDVSKADDITDFTIKLKVIDEKYRTLEKISLEHTIGE